MSHLRLPRSAALIAAVAAAYFLSGRLGLKLAFVNASATAVWPPAGIAIASLLLFGWRVWPGILLGAFLVNLTTAGTLATSVGIAWGNTLEGVLGAALVSRFASGPRFVERASDIFRYAALAGVLSTMASATIGVSSLALGGFVPASGVAATWFTWWLGDLGGVVVVAPFLVLWGRGARLDWNAHQAFEAVLLLFALVVVSLAVFVESPRVPEIGRVPQYACAPLLLWAAYRFGAREASAALVLLSGFAIWGTLRHLGPFARPEPNASLLLLQGFMAIWSVAILALAAALSERRRAEAWTRQLNDALEHRVFERTDQLWAANQELSRRVEDLAHARERLERSEARLREAQDVARMGSWEWDIGRNVVWWSDALYSIYGLDPAGFGASYEAYLARVHPDDRERVDRIVRQAYADGMPFSFEERIVRPDGEVRVLHSTGHAVTAAAGPVVRLVGTCHDITERKRVEEERAQWIREQLARREAEEANRLKDEFLAVLSHELRNPLNATLVWAQLLRDRKLDSKGVARAIDIIERNAQVQTRLIHDLLDLSRLNSGKLELRRLPVSLEQVIADALDTMRPAAEARGVALAVRLDRSPRRVLGDPERLQQVVWNLVSNAVRFSPRNGRVGVILSARDDAAEIRVEDEGPGIDPERLPVLFDAARHGRGSRDSHPDGLGLGLAIVRRVAELHGGSVAAANLDGRRTGAVLTVTLPWMSAEAERPAPDGADGAGIPPSANGADVSRPLRGLRVLLVEDDRDSAEALAMLLGHGGADVTIAGSCAEALARFEARVPEVLISDIGLPDEDGYTLIRKIRALPAERGAGVPAIAVTAYAGADHAAKALACGFQAHLAKPFRAEALVSEIASLRTTAA